MQDLFPIITQWLAQGKQVAMATVTRTWGSAPRPVGSVLAVTSDGELAGSVSGGCVEGAVLREALEVLKTNHPRPLHFGISNDDAWAVGLMCGGELEVLVQPFPSGDVQEALLQALQNNEGGILLSEMERGVPPRFLPLHAPLLPLPITKSQTLEIDGVPCFAHIFPKKSQLIIIGAAHIAVELVRLAKLFDFETIVIDPRQTFAQQTEFPEPPHQRIVGWPAEVLPQFQLDTHTYAVVLSHDPKIDDQAIHLFLHSNIGYIGALGSKKTHEKRVARLQEAGFDEVAIARIHAPVGLDIGAQGAKEIALSIVAELIKIKNQ